MWFEAFKIKGPDSCGARESVPAGMLRVGTASVLTQTATRPVLVKRCARPRSSCPRAIYPPPERLLQGQHAANYQLDGGYLYAVLKYAAVRIDARGGGVDELALRYMVCGVRAGAHSYRSARCRRCWCSATANPGTRWGWQGRARRVF